MWYCVPPSPEEKQGRVSGLGVGGRREVADRIRRDLVVDNVGRSEDRSEAMDIFQQMSWDSAKAQSSGMNEMARP